MRFHDENDRGLNIGSSDRIARFALGLFLLVLTIAGPKSPWGILGLVPITTSILGFCPLYRVLGVSSRTQCDSAGFAGRQTRK